MVEAKNKKISTKYVYGSVAYDLEPEVQPRVEKKIKSNRKAKASQKLVLMGKIIIVFVLSFLLVYRFTMVMKVTYDIRNLKGQISALKDQNENTKIDLAKMNNIKVIEKVAMEKCGMVIPNAAEINYVNVKPLTVASEKYSQSAFQMIQRLLGLIY